MIENNCQSKDWYFDPTINNKIDCKPHSCNNPCTIDPLQSPLRYVINALRISCKNHDFCSKLFCFKISKKCPLPCEQTNRCVNGTCTSNVPSYGSFNCTCISGYEGLNCKFNTNISTTISSKFIYS